MIICPKGHFATTFTNTHKEMKCLCSNHPTTACRNPLQMQPDELKLSPKSLSNTMRAFTQQLINKDYADEGLRDGE